MRRLIHGGFVVALISTVLALTAAPVGAQVQTCNGLQATIVGTPGDDTLLGTPGDDVIVALGGNDLVTGGDGDDTICLGDGNDRAIGQKGEDTIFGEAGNDLMTGGNRGDLIDGGPGNDTIRGNNGIDTLIGGLGDDVVIGGRNNDFIDGGFGDDELRGGAALDEIFGGPGDDEILAGRGRDFVDGQDGIDTLDGGLGDDQIFAIDNQSDTILDRDDTDTCFIDPFDLGIACELGDITSEEGTGDGAVTFTADTIATSQLEPSFPGGPHYVLQYAALSTNRTVEITVFDDAGNAHTTLNIPAGIDISAGNVLVEGVPSRVEITGADEWHLGIVDPLVFDVDLPGGTFGARSIVFGLDNAPGGTDSELIFTNISPVDSFIIVVVLGPGGVVVNDPIPVPAGATDVAGGTLFPDDEILGIFAPGIAWEFTEFN